MPNKVKKAMNRVVTYATVVTTIAWSMSAALIVPVAGAVTIADGDLIQPSSALFGNTASAVYYVSGSTLRVFPHVNVYRSWGYVKSDGSANWGLVKAVSAADLSGYTQGNAMPFRDGSLFRGTATSLGGKEATAVFLVSDGKLRPVKSSDVYQALFTDASWKRVTWVPDDLLSKFNYALGEDVTDGAKLYNGMVVSDGTTKYVVISGQKRAFASEAAYAANRYTTDHVVTVSATQLASVTNGTSVSVAETAILVPGTGAALAATPAVIGALVAALSSTPASAVYPASGTNLPYLRFTLTAGASAVTISGLTFTRSGVGSSADFANLYLYEGATRLTSGRSVSSATNTATFSQTLTVAANTTRTLTLVASLAVAAGHSGNINALSLTAVDTSASISGLPLAGNAMTHGTSAAGTLTIAESGAALTNIKVGQSAALVGKFTLAAATEDASFRSLILSHSGTIARSNLSNFVLKQGDKTVATATGLDSNDHLVFDFTATPYSLARGTTRTFELYANIGASSRNADTVRFYIDETTDVYAVGTTYGTAMAVTSTWASGDQTTTIEGGQVTISISGPTATTIARGTGDVNLMNFSLASGVLAEVRELIVELHRVTVDMDAGDADLAQYTDFKVTDVDSGEVIAGPVDSASMTDIGTAAGLRYTSTNRFTLTAGKTRNFKVTVDFGTTAAVASGAYFVRLGTTGSTSFSITAGIKNMDNNQYITDIVPSTVQTGQNMTLAASGLTVGLAASPSSKNAIRGANQVDAAGFVFTAAAGSPATVTSIKLTAKVDAAATGVASVFGGDAAPLANTLASKVRLLVDGKQVGTDQALTAANDATFSGLSIAIAKGTSKTVIAQIDIPNTATQDGISLDIAAGADVTAQDSEGASVTATAVGGAALAYPNGGTVLLATTFVVIQTAGEITAARDAASPVQAIVLGGQSNVEMSRFRFTTLFESMKVTKLRVNTSADGVDDEVTAVSVTYPTNTAGTTTETKSVSLNANSTNAGYADFSDLNFMIGANSDAVVIVKADLAAVGSGGEAGDSGAQPGLDLDFDSNFEALGGGSSSTSITSLGSAVTLTALAADVAGNTMVIRKTKPTIKSVAPGSTLLTVGERDLALVQVTADQSGSLDWTELTIDVTGRLNSATIGDSDGTPSTTAVTTGTGATNAITSVRLLDASATELSGPSAGTITYSNGTTGSTIRFEPAAAQTIAAGATATYTIKGTVATVAANDSILTRVSGTSTAVATAAEGTVDDTAVSRDFIWSDRSATAHATTTLDWTNGYKVKDMPSTYVGLTA